MKYRKKSVVIEAIRWTGDNSGDVADFMAPMLPTRVVLDIDDTVIAIPTLEGVMIASEGDWIIRGVAGELYPCKPDIFERTYEEVTQCRVTATRPIPNLAHCTVSLPWGRPLKAQCSWLNTGPPGSTPCRPAIQAIASASVTSLVPTKISAIGTPSPVS